jgi:CHAT domain-containing protein
MKRIIIPALLFFSCLSSYAQTWKELNDSLLYYYKNGEYEKGIGHGQKALIVSKKEFGDGHQSYALSLNNLAGLYQRMGLYVKAEPLYLESLDFRKRTFGSASEAYAMGLNNLAGLYQRMGQYTKAESLYIEATAIRKKALSEAHPNYAASLNNLATLYLSMGQYGKAETLLRQATEIRKKVFGETHPEYAFSLSNLAIMFEELDKYQEAEPLYIKAIEIFKTAFGENHPNYAAGLKNLAGLYQHMDQYQKAEAMYLEVIRIEKETLGETHPDYAVSLNNLAELYQHMGKQVKAETLLLQNSRVILKNLLNNFVILSASEKQTYLNNTLLLLETNNSFLYTYKKASASIVENNFNQQLIFKSMVLEDSKNILGAAQKSKDTVVQRLLKDWKANKNELARQYSLPIADRRTDLKTIETTTENLEKELNRQSAAFRSQQQAVLVSMKEIQKKLQQDEVAIEFVRFRLYDKKWTDSIIYAAYILKKNDPVPFFIPLCEEEKLQKIFDMAGTEATSMVSKFYRGAGGESTENAGVLGTELYKLTWAPLEPYLKGVKTISYSPAGKLYSLAFHALPVDSTTLLMDKYELRQYTSTREIALRKNTITKSALTSAVLFGDPVFSLDSLQLARQKQPANQQKTALNISPIITGSTSDSLWMQLPGTALEIKKLGQLFNTNKVPAKSYTQLSASEEQLKQLDGHSPPLLHIATHGFFLPDSATKKKEKGAQVENTYTLASDPLLRSGLVLTGGNYAWSGKTPFEGVEDGIVTAYEISQLDLSGTELVVLSACETALGDIKGSEGVFGLQRAFKMAGVKKMIVSLWQVPDKETAKLMTSFYDNLIKGRTIEDAFSLAQTEMREKYSAFYWAAFVLIE